MKLPARCGQLSGLKVAVDGRYARRPGMGIHRYLSQVIRLLCEEGAEVTMLTNFSPEPWAADYPSRVDWRFSQNATHLTWEQVTVPRLLAGGGFDLYWAPGNSGIPMRRVPRIQYLWTLHDLVPLKLRRIYLYGDVRLAGPYLLHTASGLLSSDAILTVSESSARDIRKMTGRRSHVAPPLWYRDVMSTADTSLHDAGAVSRLGIPQHGRYLVYNGGLDPRKNVPRLLDAFAAAARERPDLHLVLMGNGYEVLDDLCRSYEIEQRVVRPGYVSESDKFSIIRAAAALVYTSSYEGFGLPLLEAFANGVPVITSPNSSLLEVAGDAALYGDTASQISQAMVEILEPDVAARLRSEGAARWSAYDADGVRQSVIDVVQELTEKGPEMAAR